VRFEHTWPETVVVTTPNAEDTVRWESLPASQYRHRDHRFKRTRAEFEAWAAQIAARFNYTIRFEPIGPVVAVVGVSRQLAVFAETNGRSHDDGNVELPKADMRA
jgi:hypothetical protein